MKLAVLCATAACAGSALGQVDTFEGFPVPAGTMGSRIEFDHVPDPGAIGTDHNLLLAIAPTYAPEESHILVVTFEWQNVLGGDWFSSPDNAVSVHGGATRFFDTGHYIHSDVPARVALHFWGGGPNPVNFFVTGTYSHTSVVPAPGLLGLVGIAGMSALRRKR